MMTAVHPIRHLVPALLAVALATPCRAQMVSGADIPGFAETMDLGGGAEATGYAVEFLGSTAPANVLWPGEQAQFTFQVRNEGTEPLAVAGKVDLIRYGTQGRPRDVWTPEMFRIARYGPAPVEVNIAPGGYQDVTVQPTVPETLGAYALVLDLGPSGRRFVTSFVRTFRAEATGVRFPQLCLDNEDPQLLSRLGAAPNRIGIPYKPTTDADFAGWYDGMGAKLRAYKDAGLAITVEFGGGDFYHACQPLGRPRPWLDETGLMLDTKFDLAWLPSYDQDFREFARRFAADFGWPNGPVNAFKLWNEPWNGISISGWGADDERYREIFTAMCEGVEQARAENGVQPLLGGCDSSSNTLDKLFADGSDRFLKWLDFCSIHYQGMSPPSTVKAWVNRKGPYGRVRIWDTESWVANTDDRVGTVVATNLSTGHDRAVGVYHGNIATESYARGARVREGEGWKEIQRGHTWSVAAAVGAATHLIGERRFRELLFKNGLPWVMLFDGRLLPNGKPDAEDATVVVVGDIGEVFGSDSVLYRTARGTAEARRLTDLRARIAALPPRTSAKDRAALEAALATPEPLTGARLLVADPTGRFRMYDPYGNEVEATGGVFTVPLDHRAYYLRGDGTGGTVSQLLRALRAARVEGIEPLAKECCDLTARVEEQPTLRLRLTNVLNQPIQGNLEVELGDLTLDQPRRKLGFRPHETKTLTLRVTGGSSNEGNTYPLHLRYDAGADGVSEHWEDLHVNILVRRTIRVDGDLDDWRGIPVQTILGAAETGPSLQEYAWQPFKRFAPSVAGGFAQGWLAYDDQGLYFGARVADSTPDEGMPRFETLDEEAFFYPEVCARTADDGSREELRWPEGVRRYSYRKDPELPCGNAPNHDNIQIAFNVLPDSAKPWLPNPPGTMPRYTGYRDTDYEYALNPVAERYGGGVEVWPLRRPDLPDKHYYPRQPKAPGEGPVADAQLAIARDGNTRTCECFLPWRELPAVKAALDGGRTVKFSFRVNDNANAGCMELSRGRSVAKRNGSFHADWLEHWANELEFAKEQAGG